MQRALATAMASMLLLLACSESDDDPGGSTSGQERVESSDDDPTPGEMLAALDDSRTAGAYTAQLSRLSAACGMTDIAVADLAVHASRNTAPEQGVSISISEMLDGIEQSAGGAVSCQEIAAGIITLMMPN